MTFWDMRLSKEMFREPSPLKGTQRAFLKVSVPCGFTALPIVFKGQLREFDACCRLVRTRTRGDS
jgi:hypothetical protein